MTSNKIRIAIVGPVSTGKSTVLNSLFVEQEWSLEPIRIN